MALTASWTHGNVTELEILNNPSIIKTPRGWGAEFSFPRSPFETSEAWLHVPIPTPVLINDGRANVFRFFLLFSCDPNLGAIDRVQLYDGPGLIQSFDNLLLGGEAYLNQILPQNTFVLSQPHGVIFGLSISFHYFTSGGQQPPTALLTVSTAGCDFTF
jgi:hypothetical protein